MIRIIRTAALAVRSTIILSFSYLDASTDRPTRFASPSAWNRTHTGIRGLLYDLIFLLLYRFSSRQSKTNFFENASESFRMNAQKPRKTPSTLNSRFGFYIRRSWRTAISKKWRASQGINEEGVAVVSRDIGARALLPLTCSGSALSGESWNSSVREVSDRRYGSQ